MAVALAGTVGAQPRPPSRPAKVEIGVGLVWMAGVPLGTADATEATPGGGSFRLFSSSAALGSTPGVDVRIGVRLTDRLRVEGAGSYSAPVLRVAIRNDVETGDAESTEPTRQVLVNGSLLVFFKPWREGRRRAPFVTAGVGYLRQLHDGATLAETGSTFHAGGGVMFVLADRPRERLKSVGLRLEARAVARHGAAALDGRRHVAPEFGGGLLLGF